jgi:sigma-E factor negative regulatory protein RseB
MAAKPRAPRALHIVWPGIAGSAAGIACLLLAGSAAAEQNQNADPMAWMQKIQHAAQNVNYIGLLVYQQGQQMQASRITHAADAGGEHEKLETLDGAPKEFIRDNDEVKCYIPDTKTVVIEKRGSARPFPGLLTTQVGSLDQLYEMRLSAPDRVAGFACQMIVLTPKDNLRYGHRLCVENNSGLLLRAQTLNSRNEVIEQIAFTQVGIGVPVDRQALRSRFATAGSTWRVENAGARPADLSQSGWVLSNLPPGFRKVMELLRTRTGQNDPVGQMVLSDGMAAVSVFIEPEGPGNAPAAESRLSKQGAISVYSLQVGGHTVTVLGDAPADSVMQIGNSIEFRKP